MKKYLLIIEDEKLWNSLKKKYKRLGLGNNLNEAIHCLIRRGIKWKETRNLNSRCF